MKCYISGKMSGLDKEEWLRNFDTAERTVRAMGYEPVNPAAHSLPNWMPWIVCILYDLLWVMRGCRVIYMQANWIYSKGAGIERLWAEKQGWTILYEDKSQIHGL